jgi:hypothetical protein
MKKSIFTNCFDFELATLMKFVSVIIFIVIGALPLRFSRANALVVSGVKEISFDKTKSAPGNILIEESARKFRSEIDHAVIDADSTKRLQHFTGICSKYLHSGMRFEDLESFLRAAGASGPLTKMDQSSAGKRRGQSEYFSAIVLYHGFVSSASLLITVRATSADSDYKFLGRADCTVIRESL